MSTINKLNKIIGFLIVIAILISSSININAEELDIEDIKITTLELIPVRKIFERLGFRVVWIQESKNINIYNDTYEHTFTPYENGNSGYFLINGVSYIKLKVLSELNLEYQRLKDNDISIANKDVSRGYKIAPIINNISLTPTELEILNKNSNKVLFFWATWCPHCTKYIDNLKDMNLDSLDIDIIGINLDTEETLNNVESLLRYNKEYFLNIMDIQKDIYKLYKPKVIPTTYLINKDNMIIETIKGPIRKDDIIKLLNYK